ncbi:MAG: PduL/EutD family phosphate acyltransferase, partial [Defluviitaleaceae bacterium]|nr:PduL/EutD family phosphate acyltransferase [Defluviitaleaceae bacterium]
MENIELIVRTVLNELTKEAGMDVPVGVSARHIHLSRTHVDILFGKGYRLTRKKELMGGHYAANETVTIAGTGTIEHVRVLGPERKQTQVEISATDSIKLGVKPPVRESGDLAGSASVAVIGPKGAVYLEVGCIIAARHIHMPPGAVEGLKDGDVVSVRVQGSRGLVFDHVKVRVDPSFRL